LPPSFDEPKQGAIRTVHDLEPSGFGSRQWWLEAMRSKAFGPRDSAPPASRFRTARRSFGPRSRFLPKTLTFALASRLAAHKRSVKTRS
jgi:hypothetical protein